MCGICGIFNLKSNRKPDIKLIRGMNNTLFHRGPDSEGYYTDKKAALAMRRLSIIDVDGGEQPVYNEDKKLVTVFNGEIFNYKELRKTLQDNGHRFNSNSDTEIIPHLFEEYGESFVEKLNGQFAIALYDKVKGRLFLYRDRVGIKPLYYYIEDNVFYFASEIKAILAALKRRPGINPAAVWQYLSFSCVPQDNSIFTGVKKLLPAHCLMIKNSKISLFEYWKIDKNKKLSLKPDEISEKLLSLLKDSVRMRLISDVPLGIFLSGGLDSSTITALYKEVTDERLMTFSIGFEEDSYSELDDARQTAKHFGTEHYDYIIKPDALEIIDKLIYSFDEPFADSSAVNVYYISKFAREKIIVALSGEGGDEIFGGYMTYTADQIAAIYKFFYKALPTTHNILKKLAEWLPASEKKVSFDYKIKKFLAGVGNPPAESHYLWKEIFDIEMRKKILSKEFVAANINEISEHDPLFIVRNYFGKDSDFNKDLLNKILYLDFKTYLPDDLLVKVDRSTMANSMEVRVPLLDHRIIELMMSIPSKLKIKYFNRKILLKKIMKGLLPDFIFKKRKSGFSLPLNKWFKGELYNAVNDIILNPEQKIEWLNYTEIENLIKLHRDGKVDYSRQIWNILVLSLWYKNIYLS